MLVGLTATCALIAAAPAGAAPGPSALSAFRSDATSATVVRPAGTERASFLRGRVSAAKLGGGPAETQAATALAKYGGAVGVTDPATQLRLDGVAADASGARTARYTQVVDGVPVFASRVIVALGAEGRGLRALAAAVRPGVAGVATTPTVSRTAAENTASQQMGASRAFAPTQLVVYAPAGAEPALAWSVDRLSADGATHEITMVDARSGATTAVLDRIADARNRSIHDMAGRGIDLFLPGRLVRSEGQSATGDGDVDAAYDGTGATYDYYEGTFGRDSYDDAGAELISSVHYGRGYENAFWNGEQMVYGDGFATLDVTGHELTHAVTERTAGLEYQDQSGALNESLSDMAAWDVDPEDSTLGEDLPIGAIRDLRDPGAYGQPATGAEYDCTTADNGGVHTNSGIPNKVYANLVDALGRPAAAQVRYRAQTTYLTPRSTFADARAAFVQAAADTGASTTAAGDAWSAQGITPSWSPAC